MENLFETITKTMPKPTELQQEQLASTMPPQPGKKLPLKDLVVRWQQTGSKDDEADILRQMHPTISSAMNSYAPGMEKQLSIKAARLTLNALKQYKPDMGADPTTFVFHNLKRLNRYNSKRNNIIPQSETLQAEAKFLSDLSAKFEDDHGREPSIGELADLSGYNTKKVSKILDGTMIVNDSSTLSEDSRQSLVTQKDVNDDDYWEYVYASVSSIDQKIMEWTSGYRNKPMLSNNEIATRLKITPAAVSQRKNKILAMMSEVRGLL